MTSGSIIKPFPVPDLVMLGHHLVTPAGDQKVHRNTCYEREEQEHERDVPPEPDHEAPSELDVMLACGLVILDLKVAEPGKMKGPDAYSGRYPDSIVNELQV